MMTILQIIAGSIILLAVLIVAIIVPIGIIFNIKEKRRFNDIKDREVKNDLYRIYMDIDIVKVEEIIDNILKDYINKWVLINIDAKGGDYIKDAEVQELIRYVTVTFIADMSDVHLFYIKCLTAISDDEAIVRYVRNKVKYLVLDFITDYNSI